MRLKDAPAVIVEGAEKALHNKWLVWGGVAVLVLGVGYVALGRASFGASGSGSSDLLASGGYYTSPVVLASNGQVSAGAGTGSDYTAALVALETQKAGTDYATAIAQLNSQTILGLANAQTAQLGIQAANYQTSSQILANAGDFFKAGYNALVGTITGPDGSTTGINLAASMSGGKGSANAILTNFVNSPAFAAFNPSNQNAVVTLGPNGSVSSNPPSQSVGTPGALLAASLPALIHNGEFSVAGDKFASALEIA